MEIHCTWLFLWSKDFGMFQNMISLGSHNTRHPIRVDGDGPCYIYAYHGRPGKPYFRLFYPFRQRVHVSTCIVTSGKRLPIHNGKHIRMYAPTTCAISSTDTDHSGSLFRTRFCHVIRQSPRRPFSSLLPARHNPHRLAVRHNLRNRRRANIRSNTIRGQGQRERRPLLPRCLWLVY